MVIERIVPDYAHWQTVLPKLTTFWRRCILPEILGRWYTRKCHLSLTQFSGVKADSVCYCQEEKSGEETVTCSYKDCTIKVFHCSCIAVSKQNVPNTWYCPTCRTLPQNKRGKGKAKKYENSTAMALTSICICNKKAASTDRLLECKAEGCSHGKFFHLQCLGYKRRPNNSINWQCKNCKMGMTPDIVSAQSTSVPSVANSSSSSPVSCSSNALSIDSDRDTDSDTDTDKLECVKITHGTSNKEGLLAKLQSSDYDLILSPTGWLNCDIIQQAHVCLKRVNPLIEGFQRPTLGPCINFDVMTSEFVQILHTGHSHWVCVSSIDCTPGTIKLYDSLSNDIIQDEVQAQVESLVADSNVDIECIPVQQQLNGCDCGVFAIGFATCLVYGSRPDNFNFDVSRMRQHLHECLRNDEITHFLAFRI